MSDEIKTNEDEKFDEALSTTPEEVQDFMWSDAFDYILDIAEKTLSLTKEEKKSMRRAAYKLLLRLTDMEKVSKEMFDESVDKEKIVKILYIIHTQILSVAKNIMENTTIEDSRNTSITTEEHLSKSFDIQPQKPITTPNPLSSLQSRLTQSNMILPVKRDLSPDATPAAAPVVPTKPTIDPYRELPEK